MDLEISDVNRRAVRILGYNRMEISEENIGAVSNPAKIIVYLSVHAMLFVAPHSGKQIFHGGFYGGEIRLEEMAEVLKKTEADEKLEQEYTRGQAAEIRGAMAEEESIVRELLNFEQPVTAGNPYAALSNISA